jgi:hypothetical protein
MSNQPGTQINVSQEIQENRGQATAVRISRVTGNISFNLAERPASPTNPPSIAAVSAYLEAVAKPEVPAQDVGKEEDALWKIGFTAHEAEEDPPQDANALAQKVFARQRLRGRFQRIVLLADSGMGKTPALHYLRRERAKETLSFLHGGAPKPNRSPENRACIPLFIQLANLPAGQPMITLLQDAFNMYISDEAKLQKITLDETKSLLENYDCLFLLDDLGELLSHEKTGGVQILAHFMEIYGEHQYVISCGISRYRQQLGALDTLYLDYLADADVKKLVGEETYANLSPFAQQMAHNRGVLTKYFHLGKKSELLQTKGILMRELVKDKINQPTQVQHGMDLRTLERFLEQLAIDMRCNHTHSYSEQKFMEFISSFLKAWEEGGNWRIVTNALEELNFLVYDPERRYWHFRDPSEETYFAATAILYDSNILQNILLEVSDYWWRDIFEMLVGLYPEPKGLLLDLIDRNVYVAANCIRFVGETVGKGVEESLIDALDEQMNLENSSRRKFIVERIGESRHPRSPEALLRVIYRDWSSMVVMAAVRSLRSWQKRTGQPIEEAEKKVLHSLSGSVESVSKILNLYPKDDSPGDTNELIKILSNSLNSSKSMGLAAIGLGFSQAAEAQNALFTLLADEQADDFVAWCGVEALTQQDQEEIYLHAAELFEKREAGEDKYSHLRARAVYLLGWVCYKEKTQKLLKGALSDHNYFVRGYAIEAMARLDLVGARQKIEQRLVIENEPFVLRKAAESLGKIGTLQSIPVLEEHLSTEQARTRWAVRQAIVEIKERNAI